MVFNRQLMAGAVTLLVSGFAIAQPVRSYPVPSESLLSQVNVPEQEGIPQLSNEEVRGRVTRIDGDALELRLSNGEVRTYNISAYEEERNDLRVGSDVVLTVRGDTVLAINSSPDSTTGTASSTSGSSTSGSSSTVIWRQTTGQQTTPAPTTSQSQTAPQTTQQESQPVRGLW